MKKGLTEIICVIDKSGSMESLKSDAIGGFNAFLNAQKELEGKAIMTLALFNRYLETKHSGIDINEIPELTMNTYIPSGTTALFDAIGTTIDDVGIRLNATAEENKPEKVIFVIITDGQENSSMSFTKEQVLHKIQVQRSVYSWEFIYLGVDEDTIKNANEIGIGSDNTVCYSNSSIGTESAYFGINKAVSNFRSNGVIMDDWKNEVK